MNKKAILSYNELMAFIRILLLIIVMFAIIFLVNSTITLEVNTFDAEAELFIQQVLYSNALILNDHETGRSYPAIIDLDKFTSTEVEKALNNSIHYEYTRKIAAKLTLLDSDGSLYTKSLGYIPVGISIDEPSYEDAIISPIYFNKEMYTKWKGIPSWIPGPGGVKAKPKNIFVLIKEGSQLNQGYLKFEVIIPNS
tara:strand:+ start:1461 stop:2048 length:588 start_codon:yes stop_codon:yes gene_type:complete